MWRLAAAGIVVALAGIAALISNPGHGAGPADTADVEARALYLQGQFFLNKRTSEGLYRALDHFEKATRRAPRYAAAHAGLADAHNMLGYFGIVPAREAFPRAEAAARESLRIDPALAAGHTALAYIEHRYHWNWEAAEAGFKRAISLDPRYSNARHWYAAFLAGMGRDAEALDQERRARSIDPLALVIGANLGSMLADSRIGEAIEEIRRVIEMDRTFWPARWTLALAYVEQRRFAEADIEFSAAAELSGRTPYVLAHLGEYYAATARRQEAAAILAELETRSTRQYVSPYYRAMVQAALGQTDRAFETLEEACTERSANLPFLKIRRRLEPLRSDPRFESLLRRVGLSDKPRTLAWR